MKHIDLYEGYEGEDEFDFFSTDENGDIKYSIYTWNGYVWDIFGNPTLDGSGWSGFTRYYQEEDLDEYDRNNPLELNPKEVLDDVLKYDSSNFLEEVMVLYTSLITLLKECIEKNYKFFICKC